MLNGPLLMLTKRLLREVVSNKVVLTFPEHFQIVKNEKYQKPYSVLTFFCKVCFSDFFELICN